jgi:uncharacterized protein YegL
VPTDTDCLRRYIPVTVLQNSENSSFQPIQVQVQIAGGRASVLSFEQRNISPRVILLLDTSGSMGGTHSWKWDNALLAARFVLNAVPPQSQVALVTFSEGANLSTFMDRQAVAQKVVDLKEAKPHGSTALYDAIQGSVQLFGMPQFGDAIYIVSDGADNYGAAQRKPVSNELIRRGIRVFAFIVEDSGAKTPEERQGPANLKDFVNLAGGGTTLEGPLDTKWFASKDATEAGMAVRAQLQLPYRLEFGLAAPIAKTVKLQVTTALKGVELAYPHRIETCLPAPATVGP